MYKNLLWLGVGVIVLALFATPVSAQNTRGREMSVKVTTAVQMAGMTMPPRTLTEKACMAAQHQDLRKMVSKNLKGDCKLTDYQLAGDTITYHVACTKPEAVSGNGTLHRLAGGGFNGTQHMAIVAAGHTITTDITYAGTPTGASCVYQPSSTK